VASNAKTPPSALSGTPSPPGSPSEVSSHRPRSSVFEQGGSGKAPVVDLSSPSDEEEPIHDISRDFEFTQHLFSELNLDFLGPPGDGKKERRRARRSLPASKMWLLLLQSTQSRPTPLTT
jgi:hypothetical protein